MSREIDWRSRLPDAGVGLAVLFFGVAEVVNLAQGYRLAYSAFGMLIVVIATAVAVCVSRRAPAVGLALVWLTAITQVATGISPVLFVQLAFAYVAFATARWGSTNTVWAAGLSIVAAGTIAVVLVTGFSAYELFSVVFDRTVVTQAPSMVYASPLILGVIGISVLGFPWAAGLVMRFVARADTSRESMEVAEEAAARALRETEQAREIAELHEERAQMARDVHDVVGHSLAVILAQAESAQYIPDAETQRLKDTMAAIATSARSSLIEVRHVLSNGARENTERLGSLDELVERVRESGHEVVSTVVGEPHPLPPELEVVAYRVLQEMLTNAIRHGRREQPVRVERRWPTDRWDDALRLEVTNASTTDSGRESDGQGLDGMRRRLSAVGGRVDVRRGVDDAGTTFTVTAWVPVRAEVG